jgi:formylglycine-generating enzyme required for sulfatase activity
MRAMCFLLGLFAASAAVADSPKTFRDCPSCPEMVVIPAGSFVMGTSDKVKSAANDSSNDKEKPARNLQMKSFSLGKYEVTQAEWVALMGENPSEHEGENFPVDHVTWEMAQSFVEKLSTLTGKKYRLPSEAEWEYAARAGTSTEFYDSDDTASLDTYAWFGGNSGMDVHAVGEKKPNRFGLYDMHGNVWEWTQDCWNPNYQGAPETQAAWEEGNCESRVNRGGSWFNVARMLRSAFRSRFATTLKSPYFGLRVVRSD